MFRLAVISDVHADLHALTDALLQIDRLRCDAIVCAGDLVDFGLFPDETLSLLAERRIPTARGNHDRWAVERRASQGGGWELSKGSRRFLAALPPSYSLEREGVRVAVHHASPRGDMDGIHPQQIDFELAAAHLHQAAADIVLVGHTHIAFALDVEGVGVIANPAALLRDPADGAENPPATGTFGILELPSRRFSVHRANDGEEAEIIRRTLGR
jgi:putative phosphoesterase